VTHGFELHCKLENEPVREPNNLEINFSGGDNFHLDTLTTAECSDSPSIAEPPPPAGFDTFVGAGTGTFNGLPATISFTFTDAGEPGTSDTGSITIMQGGTTVLTCTNAALTFGNHQAHRALPR
jgi:hypothetical protein